MLFRFCTYEKSSQHHRARDQTTHLGNRQGRQRCMRKVSRTRNGFEARKKITCCLFKTCLIPVCPYVLQRLLELKLYLQGYIHNIYTTYTQHSRLPRFLHWQMLKQYTFNDQFLYPRSRVLNADSTPVSYLCTSIENGIDSIELVQSRCAQYRIR